jgi:hypothetical protein
MLHPMTKRALLLIGAALLLTAASCGGKRNVGPEGPKGDTADKGSKADPCDGDVCADSHKQMVTQIEWVVTTNEAEPPMSEVMISLTDETGSVEHETIGTFTGGCTEGIDDEAVPDAIIGLRCWHAGAGTALRIVRKGAELIVLNALLEESIDEVSYDIYGRIGIRRNCFVKGPGDS